MPEFALGRRAVGTVPAAGRVPATLLLFGLGASGTPVPLAANEQPNRVHSRKSDPCRGRITRPP